jgi:hypothetical protein
MKDTIIAINDFAISCCPYLEEVILSKQLKTIGYWGFKDNPKLKKITIYPSIEYISPTAFHLTNIELVIFKGTEKEWKEHQNINKDSDLATMFKDAKIIFN